MIRNQLKPLRLLPGWEDWMAAWIVWHDHDQAYVGYAPDNDEICRDSDAGRFILQFKEGAHEWGLREQRRGPR